MELVTHYKKYSRWFLPSGPGLGLTLNGNHIGLHPKYIKSLKFYTARSLNVNILPITFTITNGADSKILFNIVMIAFYGKNKTLNRLVSHCVSISPIVDVITVTSFNTIFSKTITTFEPSTLVVKNVSTS